MHGENHIKFKCNVASCWSCLNTSTMHGPMNVKKKYTCYWGRIYFRRWSPSAPSVGKHIFGFYTLTRASFVLFRHRRVYTLKTKL